VEVELAAVVSAPPSCRGARWYRSTSLNERTRPRRIECLRINFKIGEIFVSDHYRLGHAWQAAQLGCEIFRSDGAAIPDPNQASRQYLGCIIETLNAEVPAEELPVLDSARNEDVFSGPDSVPGRYERLFKRLQMEVAANRILLRRLAAKRTEAFRTMDKGSPWAGLAELWRLHVNANALVDRALASSRRRYF
jgi:hypothetical protein